MPSRSGRESDPESGRRSGFTIIELLVVMAVIGILANIALPLYRNVTVKADAARIMAEYTTIRLAAHEHHAQNSVFPASSQWGVVPPEIVDDLPDNFKFTYKDADYRWRRWALGSGPGPSVLLGLDVRSPNPTLLDMIAKQYEGQVLLTGNQITFLIE